MITIYYLVEWVTICAFRDWISVFPKVECELGHGIMYGCQLSVVSLCWMQK